MNIHNRGLFSIVTGWRDLWLIAAAWVQEILLNGSLRIAGIDQILIRSIGIQFAGLI